jgi:hypothetical protein
VEAFLKASSPVEIDTEGRVVVEFYYPFHKEQIEKRPNKKIVEECMSVVLGKQSYIVCRLGDKSKRPAVEKKELSNIISHPENKQEDDTMVANALRIFGGQVIE